MNAYQARAFIEQVLSSLNIYLAQSGKEGFCCGGLNRRSSPADDFRFVLMFLTG
ncbi:MAG: hypothetical protein ABR607_09160 [Pyrinomonadaceae bacterium]